MMKAPQNMMVSEREIRDVGPHPHEWVTVGSDGTGASYQECSVCGTRRYEARHSGKPVRQDWLDGAPWDQSAAKKSAKAQSKSAESQDKDAESEKSDDSNKSQDQPQKAEERQPTRSEQSMKDAEKAIHDASPRRQSRS